MAWLALRQSSPLTNVAMATTVLGNAPLRREIRAWIAAATAEAAAQAAEAAAQEAVTTGDPT